MDMKKDLMGDEESKEEWDNPTRRRLQRSNTI